MDKLPFFQDRKTSLVPHSLLYPCKEVVLRVMIFYSISLFRLWPIDQRTFEIISFGIFYFGKVTRWFHTNFIASFQAQCPLAIHCWLFCTVVCALIIKTLYSRALIYSSFKNFNKISREYLLLIYSPCNIGRYAYASRSLAVLTVLIVIIETFI